MPILNVMSYNLFGICGEKGERGEKKRLYFKIEKVFVKFKINILGFGTLSFLNQRS